MKKRIVLALLLVGIVGGLPFLFRKDSLASPTDGSADVLVIISPHSEPMKYEFEQGFRKYYRKRFGRDVRIDYRAPGGTSDIVRYIHDRFTAQFRLYWEEDKSNPPWDDVIGSAFNDPNVLKDPSAPEKAVLARKKFLSSDVGIGIDLFAGGGTFEHARNASYGYAVDGGLQKRHPEYFKEDMIPCFFAGEYIYDPQGRYYGVTLSSFGICCNFDRIKELGARRKDFKAPERWADLADKCYFNTLVAADPTKSGSANKSYEIIVQQAMHEIIPPREEKHPSPRQMDLAWARGINRVKRIMANTRTITDSAGSVTREVATGNAAAGTAIDFYGLTEKEWNRVQLGSPVVEYIPPQGGTCIGADPVQLLRGAPHRKTAEAFLDFIIGPEGQKLLCFKKGVEGGPEKYTLRHSPVRKDLYGKKYYELRTDPDYFPYEAAALSFTYKSQWTGRYFSLIRILIRCVALDVRDELREAWGAIVAAGGPEKVPLAMKEFEKLPFAYHEAPAAAKKLRKSKNNTALDIAGTTREWSDFARKQYKEAARLAREGK